MKRLTLCIVMSFAFMMCVAPCAFSGVCVFPGPCSEFDSIGSSSDILQVSFDSTKLTAPDTTTPLIRFLSETGEPVKEEVDFTIPFNATTEAAFMALDNKEVYLVEPGATLVLGDQFFGDQSDIIRLNVSHETGVNQPNGVTELHFTILSDEDPGKEVNATGYLEDGTLHNITAGFGFGDLATNFGIVVLAGSDAETTTVPEPATLLLLGCGLIGLAGYGRKKFF